MKNDKGILIYNNGGIDLGLISAMLEAEDCIVYVTSVPFEAIHILRNSNVDVILASSHLDGMEGQEFKDMVGNIKPGVSIFLLPPPIAAHDGKPPGISSECTLNLKEFVNFIQNHIKNEKRMEDEASSFKEFFFAFTDRLLQILEVNDKYFFNNDHLVAELSRQVAIKMGLEEKLVDAIHLAAQLRDIGKIGVQQTILNGTTRLGSGEFDLIKSHPVNTVQILKQLNFPWKVDYIIRHHHEHYDGNGYPDGLKGRYIPLGSRVISIADSYVAMTNDRAYRKALRESEASQEIMRLAGSQFDPEVVEVFFNVLHRQQSQKPARKNLLVLVPDEALSAIIRLNLNRDEYELNMAATVKEASSLMGSIHPALIIADEAALGKETPDFFTAVEQHQHLHVIMLMEPESVAEYPSGSIIDVVSKPVDMDELTQKIRSNVRNHLPPPRVQHAKEPLRGVTGTLEDMGITDIIQVLNMGMKTARVILLRGEERGELYLKSGGIVYVEYGGLVGCEAFYELIGWDSGEFSIFHGQTTDKVNVTIETLTLLLDAARVLDEKRRNAAG